MTWILLWVPTPIVFGEVIGEIETKRREETLKIKILNLLALGPWMREITLRQQRYPTPAQRWGMANFKTYTPYTIMVRTWVLSPRVLKVLNLAVALFSLHRKHIQMAI